jgi:hypothetical protein
MTKVEELLQRLHKHYNTVETYAELCYLVEAGRAEGMILGAEQMRQKIVAESYPCRLSEKSHCWIYRIDASVLAPKEKS